MPTPGNVADVTAAPELLARMGGLNTCWGTKATTPIHCAVRFARQAPYR